jgi:hypothetical protein
MEKQELAQMEQMLARIDASRKIFKEEMKANNRRMLAEMLEKVDSDSKAWREEIRAETEATRARTEAMREERMKANMNACMADIKNDRKETTVYHEATEADIEKIEPDS